MSTFKYTLILIGLLILLGIMLILRSAFSVPISEPVPIVPDDGGAVACTMDAMMCPDGTYVGRSGKNCQFVCPSSNVPPDPVQFEGLVTIGLEQPGIKNGLTVTPLKVEQDSRCPSDVVCIQVGTVMVTVRFFEKGVIDSARVLKLGESVIVGAHTVTLKDVKPYPISTRKILDGEYQFVMDVKGK